MAYWNKGNTDRSWLKGSKKKCFVSGDKFNESCFKKAMYWSVNRFLAWFISNLTFLSSDSTTELTSPSIDIVALGKLVLITDIASY